MSEFGGASAVFQDVDDQIGLKVLTFDPATNEDPVIVRVSDLNGHRFDLAFSAEQAAIFGHEVTLAALQLLKPRGNGHN